VGGALIHLKFVLASFVWFAPATAVLGEYIRACLAVERLIREHGFICIFWAPDLPTWLVPLFVLAGFLTLFGRIRSGLIVGLPTAAALAHYMFLAHERRQEIEQMSKDCIFYL
jgi:hypothetical protein